MKAFIVIEKGQAIWATFRKKKTARRFVEREFGGLAEHCKIEIKKLKVRRSLRNAPHSEGDHLDFDVDLE